jgi:peptidoglycan/LPS O-acetylase OafA/YrhL
MKKKLSDYTSSRDNNFNLIRFIAATLVLISHSFALTLGSVEFEPLKASLNTTWGLIAVDVFFVSSGFLIANSYQSSRSLLAFVWARFLRIYPALFVAILITTFMIGLYATKLSSAQFIAHPQTAKYIAKNTTLIFGVEHTLPGVFMDLPFRGAVNGSLWTLPYEIKMYALLCVAFGAVALLNKAHAAINIKNATLFISITATTAHLLNTFEPTVPDKPIRLFTMFFAGVTFYAWKDKIAIDKEWATAAAAALILSTLDINAFQVMYALLLPYLIFSLAYIPAGGVRKFNSLGDYSYGIYIYAFPVQQTVASLNPGINPLNMMALSFPVTLILAIASWHIIEKRYLEKKKYYIEIESAVKKIGRKIF